MFRLFRKAPKPAVTAPTANEDAIVSACDRLARCTTIESIIAELRGSGRAIVDCDGITIIQREGDEVVYVTEDAISPLWAGQRFPMRACISGMSIAARQTIVIPDIMQDRRVPLNAYIATFVRSMAMVPIGHRDPQMAMGAYWRHAQPIGASAVERLTALAHAAADALERVEGKSPPSCQVA